MKPKALLRRSVYRSEKLLQRLRFARLSPPPDGWPVLLGISFPKSGTHLLDQVLLGFGAFAPFSRRLHSFYAEYEGKSGQKRPPEAALRWLDGLRPLDVASAHLFARPQAVTRVCSPRFVPYFIYRDPRDVVVSHVFYVTELAPDHVHHRYYTESLQTFDERLRVSILGLPDAAVEFPDIAARFAPYVGWLSRPEVLCLQFEAFIQQRRSALAQVADHFLQRVPLDVPRERLIDALEAAIQPRKSPTFRSGKTGEWRRYFTEGHKRLFKEVAGDLLIQLGYEKDNDW